MKTITSNLLARTLRANAVFTLISAILLAAFNQMLMPLLSVSLNWLLPVIGAFLLLYAIDLFITSRKSDVRLTKAYYFIIGDLAWVAGSIVVLAVHYPRLSSLGIFLIDLVAIIVGIFGILQYRLVSKAKSSKTVADIS